MLFGILTVLENWRFGVSFVVKTSFLSPIIPKLWTEASKLQIIREESFRFVSLFPQTRTPKSCFSPASQAIFFRADDGERLVILRFAAHERTGWVSLEGRNEGRQRWRPVPSWFYISPSLWASAIQLFPRSLGIKTSQIINLELEGIWILPFRIKFSFFWIRFSN